MAVGFLIKWMPVEDAARVPVWFAVAGYPRTVPAAVVGGLLTRAARLRQAAA